MNVIVLADRNWSIGRGEERLVSIPKDTQLLMQETAGRTVVMGRKTFERLPGGQPLYGRRNIVLSGDPGFSPKGVTAVRDLEELLSALSGTADEDIFVIGGESVYRQLLPYAGTVHVTMADYRYDGDRFFQDLDRDPELSLAVESDEETLFDLPYTFRRYERVAGGLKRT